MKDRKILLIHDAERNISFISEGMDDHVQALLPLPESLRLERERNSHETRISILHSEEQTESQPQPLTDAARAFLAQYVPLAVLEVFPEWQGILIESPTLKEAVWVVRDHQNGQRLAQETGQSSICLDELLTQQGHTTQRTSLVRITTKERCHEDDTKNLVE
jgi:hypothetical protein